MFVESYKTRSSKEMILPPPTAWSGRGSDIEAQIIEIQKALHTT